MSRTGPSDPAGSGTQAQLEAGRHEYESFQVIVRAPSGNALSNVGFSVSDLTGPSGAVISKSNITLYREHYVNVSVSSPAISGPNQPGPAGWYPDGLIPFVDPDTGAALTGATLTAVPFIVSPSQNQPIWVDVFVPANATPGQYAGSYTVTSDQGNFTGSISLNVWHFTLPSIPSMHSSFQVWTAGNRQTSEELLRARIQPKSANTADESYLMANFGLHDYDLGYFSGANYGNCNMSPAPSVSQFQAAAAAQQPGLALYNYTADEINGCTNLYTTLQQWALNLHQAGINQLVTMAPVPQLMDDGSGTGRSAVDIWVLLPIVYNQNLSGVQAAQQKGDQLWSYNGLVQEGYSPKWQIDFSPLNFRIQPGFINQSLHLTGLLYWRVDFWTSDPWNNVYAYSGYPGEGMLIYPGSTVGIPGSAPSMRLKWLRDGVDDYEYIQMLKAAGQGTTALQIAAGVGADWTNWTKDPNVLYSARHQLGQMLDTLNNSQTPAAPNAPANPSPASGATGVSVSSSLSWLGDSAATSYDVYFGTTSSPAFLANTVSASLTPGSLQAGTTYFWKVVAKNTAGSTSSATWSFTTQNATLTAPTTPSPANAAGSVPLTATLSWSSVTGATSYQVYFGTSSNPGLAASPTGTNFNPGSLQPATVYYWRVAAVNAGGSVSSATWSFTTQAAALSAPGNLSPATGATQVSLTPTLSWSAVAGATSYDVYFGTSSSPALAGNTTSSSYAPGTLTASTVYYWRVVAKNSSSSVTSAISNFTTTAPAPAPPPSSAPMSVSPATGTGMSETFTFSFSDPGGYTNITGGTVIFNHRLQWTSACWFYYDRPSNTIWLSSDNTATWTSAPLGSSHVLQNSQCSISAGASSATASGDTVTANIAITFTPAFAGTKQIYMSKYNSVTGSTQLTPEGSWIVP